MCTNILKTKGAYAKGQQSKQWKLWSRSLNAWSSSDADLLIAERVTNVQQWIDEDEPGYEHLQDTAVVNLVLRADADGGSEKHGEVGESQTE